MVKYSLSDRPSVHFANTELVALVSLVLSAAAAAAAAAPPRYRQTAYYVRSRASAGPAERELRCWSKFDIIGLNEVW